MTEKQFNELPDLSQEIIKNQKELEWRLKDIDEDLSASVDIMRRTLALIVAAQQNYGQTIRSEG